MYSKIEIPNYKDPSQWQSGGYLYNAKNSGGFLFNPTYPSTPDEKPLLDTEFNIATKRLNNELNPDFIQLQNDIKGGEYFDLFAKDDELYQITVKATNKDGVSFTSTQTISGGSFTDENMQSVSTYSHGTTALDNAIAMMSTEGVDFRTAEIGSLSLNVLNLATSENFEVDLSNFIGASIYSTLKNELSEKLTGMLISSFGITNPIAAIAISMAIPALITEAFEMATGYDRSFGFGGEYVGYGLYEESKGFLGTSTLGNDVAGVFSGSKTTTYTDAAGNPMGQLTSTGTGIMNVFETSAYFGGFDSVYGYLEVAGFSEKEAFDMLGMHMEMEYMNMYDLTNDEFDNLNMDYHDVVSGTYADGWLSGVINADVTTQEIQTMDKESGGRLSKDYENTVAGMHGFSSMEAMRDFYTRNNMDSIYNDNYGSDGGGNDGADYGSSNNPSGGVGASGYGSDVGGFGGGM